jgi:hypothetical protein
LGSTGRKSFLPQKQLGEELKEPVAIVLKPSAGQDDEKGNTDIVDTETELGADKNDSVLNDRRDYDSKPGFTWKRSF